MDKELRTPGKDSSGEEPVTSQPLHIPEVLTASLFGRSFFSRVLIHHVSGPRLHSSAVINSIAKNNWGRKCFIWSSGFQSVRKKRQVRNSRQETGVRPWTRISGLLSAACSVFFPKATYLWEAPPTVGLPFSHQSSVMKIPPRIAYRPTQQRHFLQWDSLFPVGSSKSRGHRSN